MAYSVHAKVNWEQKVSSDWENFFYPSLVKKLKKSDEYFNENFIFSIIPVNSVNDVETFLAIYDKEIASRGNYIFKKNQQKETLSNKISEGKKYLLASIHNKKSNDLAGGILFHIVEDKLFFYLRAFDKEIRSSFRSLTTLDFWAEKKIYGYAFSQNLKLISHGTDSYPNKGRTGLVLFKLKVGGKPKISKKEHEILSLTEDDIKAFNTPTFFWDNPDENNFFRNAHLFMRENEVDESVLTELVKVLQWTGIEFQIHNI